MDRCVLTGGELENLVGPIQVEDPSGTNLDAVSPVLTGGDIVGDGTTITLKFSEMLDAGVTIDSANFSVVPTSSGTALEVTSAQVVGNSVVLALASVPTGPVRVTYTDPAGEDTSGVPQDVAGNDVGSFGAVFVDGAGGPTLTSSGEFATIAAAITAASAGDTVFVASGTYAQSLTVNKALTFIGNGGVTVESTTSTSTPAINVTGITSAGAVRFDGINVIKGSSASTYTGINIAAGQAITSFVYENGTVTGFARTGLEVTDGYLAAGALSTADNLIIRNATFVDNGASNTQVGTSSYSHIKLFGFSGSVTIADTVLTGTATLGKAIEIVGALTANGNANTFTSNTVVPSADITLSNINIDGNYLRNPVGVFNFNDLDGLSIDGLDLTGASSAWALFNIDGISGGDVYAPGYDILLPATLWGGATTPFKLIELQGAKPGQALSTDPLVITAPDVDIPGAYVALRGAGGDDVLTGGTGMDVFTASLGADSLTGGDGADVFGYASAADSTALSKDVIADFKAGGDADIINLDLVFTGTATVPAAITAASAALNGTGAEFEGNKIAWWYDVENANTQVYVDANSNGAFDAGDMQIQLSGQVGLVAADFII